MTAETAAPRIESGAIVALRLFDIAYAIDLAAAERLWAVHASAGSRRSQLSMTPAKAVTFDVPPVLLNMDALALEVDGVMVNLGVTARLYDFGVVAFALRLPVRDLEWSPYCRLLNALDAAVGPEAQFAMGTQLDPWGELRNTVTTVLAAALTKPTHSTMQEDYLLGIVHGWSEAMTAADVQARVDLVPLLSGERRRLSEGARRDLLRNAYSYFDDDLVVLTWDRAFIYEPRADNDVADVIEVANAQLLELRYYDELLDDELPRMYDLVEAERGSGRFINPLAPRRFAGLARRLHTLVAEVTEITEQVDNALQVTEDVYLARIYSTALDQFRVPAVAAAVDRKLAIIRDTYTALYEEASGARGALMEAAIVLLIVFEIVLALMGH
ncbi:hypothetical protein [Nevskia sp.]|uniref:hypothetical protein n=1 Tax=Nevskia sp. TaxID=1929292 RepID=UPI0025E129B1|nr:hypothetical protein [Nevskia sp.]